MGSVVNDTVNNRTRIVYFYYYEHLRFRTAGTKNISKYIYTVPVSVILVSRQAEQVSINF